MRCNPPRAGRIVTLAGESRSVRNPTLHELLERFVADAAARLALAAHSGDEVPFEVISTGPRSGRMPFYAYRALTDTFIAEHFPLLTVLPSFAPAVRALEDAAGIGMYLRAHGPRAHGKTPVQAGQVGAAELALQILTRHAFEGRNDFELGAARFESAYAELERALYEARCVSELVTPLRGIDLDPATDQLALDDGLSIVRTRVLAQAPTEFARAPDSLLLVLRVAHERGAAPSAGLAHARLRRVLSALRLYQSGSYALGPLGYSRLDGGAWAPFAFGSARRPRRLTLIAPGSEAELRDFCKVLTRRLPTNERGRLPDNSGAGEIIWALNRFEMGCERDVCFEALTDYLLALRALFEPEGPASGRLAGRVAVICAPPERRAALAARIARADALERRVIAGTVQPELDLELLVDELAEDLRAVLRDVVCGHLESDLCELADALIDEGVAERAAAAA